jgi:hypothetical protein
MKTPVLATLALSLTLAGCGTVRESRLNPFNWFGRSTESPASLTPAGGYDKAIGDNRALVAQVTRFEVKPAHGGAILSAAGLPPTQGWWDAELVAENDGYPEDGVLTYRFVVAEPLRGTPVARRVSTPESREVTVAKYISNLRLAGVRRIVVTGAGNARSVNR